jgi:hypothetical protein
MTNGLVGLDLHVCFVACTTLHWHESYDSLWWDSQCVAMQKHGADRAVASLREYTFALERVNV